MSRLYPQMCGLTGFRSSGHDVRSGAVPGLLLRRLLRQKLLQLCAQRLGQRPVLVLVLVLVLAAPARQAGHHAGQRQQRQRAQHADQRGQQRWRRRRLRLHLCYGEVCRHTRPADPSQKPADRRRSSLSLPQSASGVVPIQRDAESPQSPSGSYCSASFFRGSTRETGIVRSARKEQKGKGIPRWTLTQRHKDWFERGVD